MRDCGAYVCCTSMQQTSPEGEKVIGGDHKGDFLQISFLAPSINQKITTRGPCDEPLPSLSRFGLRQSARQLLVVVCDLLRRTWESRKRT